MSKLFKPKMKLNEAKVNKLFQVIQKNVTDKYVAMHFGVAPSTIYFWKSKGEEYIEQFDELLSDIYQIDTEFAENEFDLILEKHTQAFFEKNGIEYSGLMPDKYKYQHRQFINEMRAEALNAYITQEENEILDNIRFDENDQMDYEIRLYIKFKRVYDRARLAKELYYVTNIDNHASSSKNVGLSLTMLKLLNKDEFAEKPTEVNMNHSGKVEVVDLISASLEAEKMLKEQQDKD